MRPLKDKAAIMPKAKTAAERAKKSRDKRKSFGEKEVRLSFQMMNLKCSKRCVNYARLVLSLTRQATI
jgi:hypothetical protein